MMTTAKTKSLLCGALLLLTAVSAAAQDTLIVGTKSDGTALKAIRYTFSKRIDDITLSAGGDYLCLSFRNATKKRVKSTGELGFYDLTNHQFLWYRPFKFTNQEVRAVAAGVLTRTHVNTNIVLYGRNDGVESWAYSLYPVHISDSLGIMMGYKSANSKTLCITPLRYGGETWIMEVPHEYGWNEVHPLGNGKSLVVADNLHLINMLDGTMRTYKGKTGVSDTRAMLLKGLVAVVSVGVAALGAASSGGGYYYYYVPTGKDVITGLASNILVEDSCYFWADRNHIACLDTTLNTIWRTPIEHVKAARSALFRQDDKLYMVNYGYGMASGSRRKYGRPFIACYDANNGEELFFNRLSTKKERIEDALRTEDALFLLFDDGMAHQSLTDTIVNITPWNTDDYGKLKGILPPYCYVANEDTTAFELLVPEYNDCIVYNNNNEVFRVNADLTISASYDAKRVYVPVFTLQDYLCIINGQRTDIRFIHHTGMPVAHLTVPFRKGRVAGNKLILLSEENQLLFLNLDEAI
jgi:hypothetical protein